MWLLWALLVLISADDAGSYGQVWLIYGKLTCFRKDDATQNLKYVEMMASLLQKGKHPNTKIPFPALLNVITWYPFLVWISVSTSSRFNSYVPKDVRRSQSVKKLSAMFNCSENRNQQGIDNLDEIAEGDASLIARGDIARHHSKWFTYQKWSLPANAGSRYHSNKHAGNNDENHATRSEARI